MTVAPLVEHAQEMPEPQGHAIGFFNTQQECDAFVQKLNATGFSDSTITVLGGEDGIKLFDRMMEGSLWGETAEDIVRQGRLEMSHGHFTLVIESPDRDQALAIANLSTSFGGHAFYHFGKLTDERLTR